MTAPVCKGCGKVIAPHRLDDGTEGEVLVAEPVRMDNAWWHVSCAEDQVAGHEADEREATEIRE